MDHELWNQNDLQTLGQTPRLLWSRLAFLQDFHEDSGCQGLGRDGLHHHLLKGSYYFMILICKRSLLPRLLRPWREQTACERYLTADGNALVQHVAGRTGLAGRIGRKGEEPSSSHPSGLPGLGRKSSPALGGQRCCVAPVDVVRRVQSWVRPCPLPGGRPSWGEGAAVHPRGSLQTLAEKPHAEHR